MLINCISARSNCISARSVPQILSIKGDYTFSLLNFLMIGLCNSSANCWSDIFSLLIPLPANLFASVAEVFLSKSFFMKNLVSIIFNQFLGILNPLSRNILSEVVLLVKYLKCL